MTAPETFNVTHSQRYFDKPNGERLTTVFTVKPDQDRFYATAPKFGCSKSYATAEGAIRAMCADHAQDVHSIEPQAPEPSFAYEAEMFYCSAEVEGVGVVWEETLPAADALSIVTDLASSDRGRNVIAENGYDVSAITIRLRAVPLSEFDKDCQRWRAQSAARLRAEAAAEAEAKALEAAEETARAATRARTEAKLDADLIAAGIEFAPTQADSAVSAWRVETAISAARVIATALRKTVYAAGPAWTLYDREGNQVATAQTTLGLKRELLKLAQRA